MFDLTALGFPPGTVLRVRDILVVIVILLGIYILLAVLRYRRLRREDEAEADAGAPAAVAPSAPPVKPAPAASVASSAARSSGARQYEEVQQSMPEAAEAPAPAWGAAVAPGLPPGAGAPLPLNLAAEVADTPVVQAIERDLSVLRQEINRLQGELAVVQDEMRERFAQLQATQNMSPLYSDAMQMAAAGHDAQTIADRCNIARAEADLVVALVRNQGGDH